MINGGETAEAHGQILRLNGDFFIILRFARRDHHRFVVFAFFFRQQGDKSGFQFISLCLRFQFTGVPRRQYLAVIHRNQVIETLRLFHIGGRHQHTHILLAFADTVDKLPELGAGEGINPGGRFVEDQQFRIVDQCAAQPELLFHPAGKFPRRAVTERSKPGTGKEIINPQTALFLRLTEQPSEKIHVFKYRQGVIKVLPQSLRHIGNTRADGAAVFFFADIAVQYNHITLLHFAGTGDQGDQGGFPDTVRPDQPHHLTGGDVQRDIIKGAHITVMMRNLFQGDDCGVRMLF